MDKFDALLESVYSDKIAKLREDKQKISESKNLLLNVQRILQLK